jgi:ATP-dependent Clp protease protease subunit
MQRDADHSASSARVDEARRTIYLVGAIDEAMLAEALAGLRALAAKPKPIYIVLASSGGGVDEGMALYDAIRTCPRRVIVEVVGYAQSMAMLVLQAAAERRLSPEARLLIHDGEAGVGPASPDVLNATVREMQHLDQRYYEILAQRAQQPVELIRSLCKAETYMSAEEAVDAGLADAILRVFNPPRKRGRMARRGRGRR